MQGLVRTLLEWGFLQQDEKTRNYQLGLKIYELGFMQGGSLEINQKGSNPAHKLAKRTQRLVHIAILQKDSAVITLDAYPRSELFLFRQLGPRVPLYCTALRKTFLAFMERSQIEAYLE